MFSFRSQMDTTRNSVFLIGRRQVMEKTVKRNQWLRRRKNRRPVLVPASPRTLGIQRRVTKWRIRPWLCCVEQQRVIYRKLCMQPVLWWRPKLFICYTMQVNNSKMAHWAYLHDCRVVMADKHERHPQRSNDADACETHSNHSLSVAPLDVFNVNHETCWKRNRLLDSQLYTIVYSTVSDNISNY